jgi:hypothetical protein
MRRPHEGADAPQRQASRHEAFAGLFQESGRGSRRPRAIDDPVIDFLQGLCVHAATLPETSSGNQQYIGG